MSPFIERAAAGHRTEDSLFASRAHTQYCECSSQAPGCALLSALLTFARGHGAPPEMPMKSSTIEELEENLHKLLASAEAILRTSADQAGEKVDDAVESAGARLRRTCSHLRQARDELTNKARSIDETVRGNPWWALGATAVVAFVAGLSVRRR
jgi:ElaB/YqjD/DUF883 family membrane-anchored ribosome-binding protein